MPVVLGSPEGHFSNTAHFLETTGTFEGCIRNLEINNKLYNFALQNNGGDAIEGVDISKYSTKIRFKTMMLNKQIPCETFIFIDNISTFLFLQKDECQGSSEEESCKSVKCHHHGSCAMKSISLKDDLTGNESDKDREENVVLLEPYCRCPLGFHGQFCEKAVDVQVMLILIFFDIFTI